MRKFLLLSVVLASACRERDEPPPLPPPEAVAPFLTEAAEKAAAEKAEADRVAAEKAAANKPAPEKAAPEKAAPEKSATGKAGAAKSGKGVQVQVPIGGDNFSQPRLTFTISAVYEKQKPTDAPPYHAPGGDWLFFDAATIAAEPAKFTVGLRAPAPKANGDIPFSFGDAILAAVDRTEGARFVAQLAMHFHTSDPPAPAAQQKLGAFKCGASVFGRDLAELPGGGFSTDGVGSWTATKLFPQLPGHDAEVFFNFSLKDKRGEFAEKDPDYRRDLLAVMAQVMRDGGAKGR